MGNMGPEMDRPGNGKRKNGFCESCLPAAMACAIAGGLFFYLTAGAWFGSMHVPRSLPPHMSPGANVMRLWSWSLGAWFHTGYRQTQAACAAWINRTCCGSLCCRVLILLGSILEPSRCLWQAHMRPSRIKHRVYAPETWSPKSTPIYSAVI